MLVRAKTGSIFGTKEAAAMKAAVFKGADLYPTREGPAMLSCSSVLGHEFAVDAGAGG